MNMNANKALHRTGIPLRSVAAGELGRWQGFGRACGLNPADVARRLGGGHKDEVAVSNTGSPGAMSQICGICCDSPPHSAPIPPNC